MLEAPRSARKAARKAALRCWRDLRASRRLRKLALALVALLVLVLAARFVVRKVPRIRKLLRLDKKPNPPKPNSPILNPAIVSKWLPERFQFTFRLHEGNALLRRAAAEQGQAAGTGASSNKVAVLIPLVASQLSGLRQSMAAWSTQDGFPCLLTEDKIPAHSQAPGSREAPKARGGVADTAAHEMHERLLRVQRATEFTLLFYYEREPGAEITSEEIEAALRGLWLSLGEARHCFSGGVRFKHAAMPKELNQHFSGACSMFYDAFGVARDFGQDHFFLMEPDVSVIRSGWLDALAREADQRGCSEFWQRGSAPLCHPSFGDLARRQDMHINGNALYCTGDPGFHDYLARVRAFYPGSGERGIIVPGCITGDEFEDGYDHCLYRFRMHPMNRDYVLPLIHKFSYTPFILNFCEDEYSVTQVRAAYPNSFLVHSKAIFRAPVDKLLRELHISVLGSVPDQRLASYKEMRAALLNGTEVRASLLRRLCLSDAFNASYHAGHRAPACNVLCDELSPIDAPAVAVPPSTTLPRVPPFCAAFASERKWKAAFPGKVYVWSSDFHVAPIACNREIYEAAGAVVHAEVDFGNCMYHKDMCKQRLKVLSFDNWRGFSLDPCPNRYRRRFFEAYRDDGEMKRVDIVICSHPVANCELYMPLNRSLVIYPTTRLEFGRHDDVIEWRKPLLNSRSPLRWEEWVANLVAMAKQPHVALAANNLFDVHYVRYHTGLVLEYLPSWCDLGVTYSHGDGAPRRPFLMGPYRDNLGHPYRSEDEAWRLPLLHGLREAVDAHGANRRTGLPFEIKRISEVYPHGYSYEDIAAHPAVVFMPYQVSVMSFFELYRMAVPIFAPARPLLVEWTRSFNFTWERVYGHPRRLVHDPAEPFDPTSNAEADLQYWLSFCDIYVFPHVTLFSSWRDLLVKLEVSRVFLFLSLSSLLLSLHSLLYLLTRARASLTSYPLRQGHRPGRRERTNARTQQARARIACPPLARRV
jgi:hypothetical protein